MTVYRNCTIWGCNNLRWHRIHVLIMNGILSTDGKKLATVYLDLIPATDVRLEYLRIEMSFSSLYKHMQY